MSQIFKYLPPLFFFSNKVCHSRGSSQTHCVAQCDLGPPVLLPPPPSVRIAGIHHCSLCEARQLEPRALAMRGKLYQPNYIPNPIFLIGSNCDNATAHNLCMEFFLHSNLNQLLLLVVLIVPHRIQIYITAAT